jgi:hypothetical protein
MEEIGGAGENKRQGKEGVQNEGCRRVSKLCQSEVGNEQDYVARSDEPQGRRVTHPPRSRRSFGIGIGIRSGGVFPRRVMSCKQSSASKFLDFPFCTASVRRTRTERDRGIENLTVSRRKVIEPIFPSVRRLYVVRVQNGIAGLKISQSVVEK